MQLTPISLAYDRGRRKWTRRACQSGRYRRHHEFVGAPNESTLERRFIEELFDWSLIQLPKPTDPSCECAEGTLALGVRNAWGQSQTSDPGSHFRESLLACDGRVEIIECGGIAKPFWG